MKKILLLLVVMVAVASASASASAQVYVAGNVGFWHDSDKDYTAFKIEPEVGYTLNDQWALGLNLGYSHQKLEVGDGTVKENIYMVAPYARYTYFEKGIVRLFLDGGFGFSSYKLKGTDNENGFEIGIKPGIAIKLTDRISLTSKLGFIGYRDDYYYAGDENYNGFGLSVFGEDLSLGVSVSF